MVVVSDVSKSTVWKLTRRLPRLGLTTSLEDGGGERSGGFDEPLTAVLLSSSHRGFNAAAELVGEGNVDVVVVVVVLLSSVLLLTLLLMLVRRVFVVV